MRAPQTPRSDSARAFSPTRLLAILVVLTALALSPVLFAGFIRLDDYRHILENSQLQKAVPANLAAFWTKPYFGLYIPITYSLWWVVSWIGRAFGTLQQTAWLFHALNLACHLVNATLVFFVVHTLLDRDRQKQSGRSRMIALLSALFFALHPVQVETVAWISEFKGELSTTFGLLGIWHHYRRSKRTLTAALFVAAMLAKPSAIVFPGILLLTDRILLGRSLKQSAAMPALLGLLLLPLVVVTKYLQPDINLDFLPTVPQRLLVATDALAFYVCKLMAPFPLALDYGRSPHYVLSHVHGWQMVLSALLLLFGVGVVVHALARPRPSAQEAGWYSLLSCGWSIFALSVVPVLGLVPFEFQDISTVADHYVYVAMFGASLMVAGFLVRFRASARAVGVAVVALAVLGGLTFRQARLWRSTETLFGHTLTVNRRSYLAHYSIATELMDTGRLDRGIQENQESLAINPDYLYAEVALGVAWIRKGNYQAAVEHYEAALAKQPNHAGKRATLVSSIHNNLGMALHQVGRDAEGTEQFRMAVKIDPESVNGHLNLGNAAFNDKRYLDAIAEYEIARSLGPGNPAVEEQLALARRGARKALSGGKAQPPP
jgi:hypothetical protein